MSTLDTLNDPYEMMPDCVTENGEHLSPRLIQEKFVRPFAEKGGFICLSAAIDDPVLWAHYAGRHTGMAFEFEFPADFGELMAVEYGDQRVKVQIEEMATRRDFQFFKAMYYRLFRTKFTSWAYEKEYRFLVPISDESLKDGLHFKQIPEQLFRRVILGCDCHAQETAVRHTLDDAGFRRVGVVRVELSDRDFRMIVPHTHNPA